jgi:hypothetical protein
VIPTVTDYSAADQHKAWDVWWNIFNGLHAAVGYRTEMWIGDRVMYPFGKYITIGSPFVSSWLQMVMDDTEDYKTWTGGRYMYKDDNRKIQEPMGRPSAVVVCGHEDDTGVHVENLGRAGCLRQFWYDN